MKQTINRISNRVGDWFATLFSLTALLLVPHAIIRPIIGYGLHYWIPIQWLALHILLIISHDPNTCSNSMSAGIRSLAIYGKE